MIANNRVVFNIVGNAFRLFASFNCKFLAGYIKFCGTRAEYDRIDAPTVDQTESSMAKRNLDIELVKSAASHRRALQRLAVFFDHPPKHGSANETEFELLMMMVDRFEATHHPAPAPNPIAAIELGVPGEVLIRAS